MSVRLPNGSLIALAATYGATKNMTAVSNANPAVATLEAAHGIIVGDVMEIFTSGWERLDKRVVRSSVVATNDVSLEGINALSTTTYPAAGGVGTIREILTWTQLGQILNTSSSGGEQQFLTFQFLESSDQKRIPTVKNPFGLGLTVADDPTLPGQILAAAADDDRLQRAVRVTLPGGGFIYYNSFLTLSEPSLTVNELMQSQVTLSLLARSVRYAT